MKKFKSLVHYALPIATTAIVTAGVLIPVTTTVSYNSGVNAIKKTSANNDVTSVQVKNENPIIYIYATQDYFLPHYTDSVMDRFGTKVTYTSTVPGESITETIKWPRLVASDSTDPSTDDLITFEELFPNSAIAESIASKCGCEDATSTVLYKDTNGNWQNHLADITKLDLSSILATSENVSGTTTEPMQNLVAIFMNPFLYGNTLFTASKLSYSDFDATPTKNPAFSYPDAYQNITEIQLNNNDLTTLPDGLFYFVQFANSFRIDISYNTISKFNPSQLFKTSSFTATTVISVTADNTYLSSTNFGSIASTASSWGSAVTSSNLTFTMNDSTSTGLCAPASVLSAQLYEHITNDSQDKYWPSKLIEKTYENSAFADNGTVSFDTEMWYYIGYIGWVTGDLVSGQTYSTITPDVSKADDFYGKVTLNADITQGTSTANVGDVEVSGLNESMSGIILEAILLFSFAFVLYFAAKKIYYRSHRKLTKEEKEQIKLQKAKMKSTKPSKPIEGENK